MATKNKNILSWQPALVKPSKSQHYISIRIVFSVENINKTKELNALPVMKKLNYQSSSIYGYMYQRQTTFHGRTRTSEPPFYLFPRYLKFHPVKDHTTTMQVHELKY